jgi:hypothetical protein
MGANVEWGDISYRSKISDILKVDSKGNSPFGRPQSNDL